MTVSMVLFHLFSLRIFGCSIAYLIVGRYNPFSKSEYKKTDCAETQSEVKERQT